MNNQSKKLNELKKTNDSIFKEIFGFGKKPDENKSYYENDDILIDSQLRLIIKKTNSTIEKPLPTAGDWSQMDWTSNELNWLEGSEFKAQSAMVNKEHKVEQFRNCIWQVGEFMGGKFIGGEFNGGEFNGQFGPGAKWNASIFSFKDGTTMETGTILGIPNITDLNKGRFKFNIIAVVPGNDIIINISNGITHKISVLKRLDDKNSLFSYNVTNGVNNEQKNINVSWSELRGQNATELQSNTVFATNAIPGIFTKFFKLSFNAPIKNVEIKSSTNLEKPQWSEVEETPADLSKKQVSYMLSKLPFGMPSIPRQGEKKDTIGNVYFNFPSATEQAGFNEIVKALEKNWLSAYIKKVRAALDNGVISEIPAQYPYLANLMKSDVVAEAEAAPSEPVTPVIDQDTQNALLGIENFLKYFVGTMVRRFRKSGTEKGLYDIEDTVGKNAIKNKLKILLKPQQVAPVNKTQRKQARRYNTANAQKKNESKEVRDYIFKILSENLKHF